jgi:hypothetical protein
MLVIMVAPVVVQPEVDSKIASIRLRFRFLSKMKGIEPNTLNTNQKIATIKNPSFILMFDFSFLLGRYVISPKKKTIKKDCRKLSILWA